MNNSEIKVSVIIPIYNGYAYLRPALDSILDQTLQEIEVICVDDGSVDHTLTLLKEYHAKDGRVRIITETNAGAALARNNGLRRARGEYVIFLDADDFFEPTLLESLYTRAKKDNLDITIAQYDIYNSREARFEKHPGARHSSIYKVDGVTSKNEHPDLIFDSTTGSAWNKLFSHTFLMEKKLSFLADVKIYEDVYFTITALSLAERVGKVHEVLVHHRIHSSSAKARSFRKYYEQVPFVFSRIREFLRHNGMYDPLMFAYLNLSASRCYKLYNLLPSDLKDNFWDLLHTRYVEALGWNDREYGDFESEELCDFVANVQVFDYKQYKRRCQQGRALRLDRLPRTYKHVKHLKRIKVFFSSIFKRKKAK